MKNKINLLFLLSVLAAGCGFYWKRQQDKNKEYHKKCLYLAVLDDAIARLELEGKEISGKKIRFPSREDSLWYRYELFLQMYAKEKKIISDVIRQSEERLRQDQKEKNL